MFPKLFKNTAKVGVRSFTTSGVQNVKVAVLGAAGGIGQPMSLLLKDSDMIDQLALYDVVNCKGVAQDLSHINSIPKVTGHSGPDQLKDCLKGSDIVVIPAGVPRKPGMTRDDLFNTNASIAMNLANAAAKYCPEAMMCIISNPVNSTVPIVAETFKKHKVYDPRRLFGVTTLDVVRANTFVAENQGWDPEETEVTVIGGHAGHTILPLLSQVEGATFSQEDIEALTQRIQFGGDEVVKAKEGAGSATLSMAFAGVRFVNSLLMAMDPDVLDDEDEEGSISECSYVENPEFQDQGVPFFSARVELGPEGVRHIYDIGELSKFEQAGLEKALPELKASIEKGVAFAQSNL